jgi:hypothetical protein
MGTASIRLDTQSMKRGLFACVAAALAAVTLAVPSGVASSETSVTAKQLITRFQAATTPPRTLRVNKPISWAGHYEALDLVNSMSVRAQFGTFRLHLVTSADLETDVEALLADGHTGVLGAPDARGIYWEKGTTLQGQPVWLAKKRYGKNVVMWSWLYGAKEPKADPPFNRLNQLLTKKVVR